MAHDWYAIHGMVRIPPTTTQTSLKSSFTESQPITLPTAGPTQFALWFQMLYAPLGQILLIVNALRPRANTSTLFSPNKNGPAFFQSGFFYPGCLIHSLVFWSNVRSMPQCSNLPLEFSKHERCWRHGGTWLNINLERRMGIQFDFIYLDQFNHSNPPRGITKYFEFFTFQKIHSCLQCY